MADFFQELPKAELHLHLEGSADPETMREFAPGLDLDAIRSLYQFSDFLGFLHCFKWVAERLRTPEDYALLTRRLLQRLERENVRYAEITLAAGVVLWKKMEFAPVYQAVRQAAAESKVEVRWILDAIRHLGVEPAMRVAELAASADGAVAFGIGGDEERGPAEWFGEVFRFAKSRGLHLTAHAGETMGPESIWTALEIGAERIGHGIRAIEDPALVRYLRDHKVPLEVCVTSNLMTGVVGALRDHPLRKLHDAGIPITLNSDDPGIFGSGISQEYALAAREFGFSESELKGIARNAFHFAFRSTSTHAA